MIEFDCVECREPLSVPDSLAGETQKCPKCGHKFVVPGEPANGSVNANHKEVQPVQSKNPIEKVSEQKQSQTFTEQPCYFHVTILAIIIILAGAGSTIYGVTQLVGDTNRSSANDESLLGVNDRDAEKSLPVKHGGGTVLGVSSIACGLGACFMGFLGLCLRDIAIHTGENTKYLKRLSKQRSF